MVVHNVPSILSSRSWVALDQRPDAPSQSWELPRWGLLRGARADRPHFLPRRARLVRRCAQHVAAVHGGGNITPSVLKMLFGNLSASCQYLPAVGEWLIDFGFSRELVSDALDLSGAQWCLDSLAEQQVFVANLTCSSDIAAWAPWGPISFFTGPMGPHPAYRVQLA